MGICLSFGKHRQKIVGLSLFSLLLFYCSTLYASQVALEWDPSDSANVEGYNLYMRVEGQTYDYTSPAWSGPDTTCSIDQLESNTYYFVARAYAASDESIDSNEVEYKVVVNSAPVSDAGTDQAVSAGTQVTLDGSGSTDSDGTIAGYQWTQTSGPTVSLSSLTSSQATFTTPGVTESTDLSFQLAVTDDGGLTNSDTCQVTVLPVVPKDSDDDGLTDAEETDIYGTDPFNADSDGDGVSDGQEVISGTDPTTGGTTNEYAKIWIEAEDGDINFPMEIGDNAEASEGSYIWVPDKAGKNGYAEYAFEVQTAGEYLIWGRVISNNNASDSFYVSVDGGSDTTWHTKLDGNETWAWDVVSIRKYNDARDSSNPLAYRLDAGVHTLAIKQREDGTKIDRILITNDMNYVPEGVGEQAALAIQKIWIEAEDGEIYAPMEVGNDSNASAGGYIVAPNGTGIFSDPTAQQAGYAEYTFSAPSSGDYIVWGRMIANDNASDSLFVTVDNGQSLAWHTKMGGTDTWAWDVVSNRNYDDVRDASNPLVYHLEAGIHTLRIQQREDGTKIDRILITNDENYIPEGEGELSTSTTQEIWIEAEDGDIYAPMEVADDSNASAGGYIVASDGTGIFTDPTSQKAGYAEYTFSISISGDYLIWSRVIANDNASDSLFVTMDNGQALTWHTKMAGTDTWTWDVVSDRNYDDVRDASNPLIYHLEAGVHTLRIQQREDGTKIDKILISNDLEATP